MVYFDIKREREKEKCPVHRFERIVQVQAPEIFDKRLFGLADIKGTDKIIPRDEERKGGVR